MKVIVVGAGGLGSWCAWNLQNSGAEVTLIDPWGPGNSRSSSGGETRVIRTVYGADEFYVEMAKRSMDLWSGFQSRVGESLMELTGSLWLCGSDDSYVQASRPKIESLGLSLLDITLGEARERWPAIDLSGIEKIVLEPGAGFLRARKACEIVVKDFIERGGKSIEAAVTSIDEAHSISSLALSDGRSLSADQIVFACGPWLKNLFPNSIGRFLQVSRQEVYYFGTDPASTASFQSLPIWLELNDPIYYGIPGVDQRGFKIARDVRGEEFNPTNDDRTPTESLVQMAREFLAKRFPGLENAPLLESRVCQYTNTPNGHFLMDRHQATGTWIVGGGCGHGFKMGPVIGEMVAAAILENSPLPNVFGLDQLSSGSQGTTQFDHA